MTAPNVRPIDRWFVDEVLPHERAYIDYARRTMRHEDEAGDVVQEAYAKLFTLDGWAAIANPPGYVMRMIRNIAIDRIRQARVVAMQPLPSPAMLDLADETPDSFRVVAAQTQMTQVQHAISALPERCRVALVRRRFAEETPREIAQDLGISVSTFEKRLARAVELLTHALTPQDRWQEAQRSEEGARKALL
ncbi:RNA polymerase sigma factor [Sphingomonas sp. PL-96]|uniref:RNA polymerase sigma factor n=1 Tax=Sphingomonas sp. PL-96 TaxID=2887201 RepID=UPI001E2DF1C8|nr:RNA polymerase sigma factor [Sphingomonas sp. PL-96]MCC2977046.1 RNA polymerase sigma factor [Sphingomonas sp. PL-96]